MANPKSRISKTRKRNRRTHYKAVVKAISICPTTGEAHLPHRAYMVEGKMYYNGKLLIDTESAE